MKPQEHIRQQLEKALNACGFDTFDKRLLNLEKPKQENFGDASSPAAMNLAKVAKKAPRQIAQKIIDAFEIDPHFIEKIEIAGPGFINFYLANSCLRDSVRDIINEGIEYGKTDAAAGKRIQLEFVSANPTGPLNIVSARAASVGDVLANLFQATGIAAQREYYVNDAGRQIQLLGESLEARYLSELGNETSVPEDGYHGDYLIELAKEIVTREGDKYQSVSQAERCETFSQKALEYMLGRHQASMKNFRVDFDIWFLESKLRESKAHLQILERLKENGHTYVKDDAVWFKSSEFGDEKDRVLVTSEDRPTYFLVDIAYHEDKFLRGFDRIIDFWGPDHHGYIPRMSAALQALGHPKENFDVSIIQQVNLLRNGQTVKMSKRAGEIIEMDELIDEVGVDAARFFFVNRRLSQPLDFDIELAKQTTNDNPVYYVQYAHARIRNIMRFAEEQGIEIPDDGTPSHLTEPAELAVIKHLLDFPDVIARAAELLEPHRLPAFLHDTATLFHKFYHDHRVVTEDTKHTESRLLLCKATRQVFANGLALLGITAPESM